MKQKLAILLSGSGSNARHICLFFNNHPKIEVTLLMTNKENSGAKAIAEDFRIPYYLFNREQFYHTEEVLTTLSDFNIDTLVLAGFLWLIPEYLLHKYPNHIINIHPSLLPKHGGKGMHGIHVHQAVWQNEEKESGITIHLCNTKYDEGTILFQQSIELEKEDLPETIQQKVLQLEHQYYAPVIEKYCLNT